MCVQCTQMYRAICLYAQHMQSTCIKKKNYTHKKNRTDIKMHTQNITKHFNRLLCLTECIAYAMVYLYAYYTYYYIEHTQ